MQRPTNTTQVKSFLGAVGWYRSLIKGFGIIARPLTQLLKLDTPFAWGAEQEAAWAELKQKLLEDPVLRLPRD